MLGQKGQQEAFRPLLSLPTPNSDVPGESSRPHRVRPPSRPRAQRLPAHPTPPPASPEQPAPSQVSPSGPARSLPHGCAPRAPLSVQRLHFAPSPPSPPRRSPPPAHRTAEPTAPPQPLRVPASVGAGRARAGPGCSRPLSREPSAGCRGRQGPRVGGGMAGGRGAPAWPA